MRAFTSPHSTQPFEDRLRGANVSRQQKATTSAARSTPERARQDQLHKIRQVALRRGAPPEDVDKCSTPQELFQILQDYDDDAASQHTRERRAVQQRAAPRRCVLRAKNTRQWNAERVSTPPRRRERRATGPARPSMAEGPGSLFLHCTTSHCTHRFLSAHHHTVPLWP